jgi:hypothetical protein
MQRGAWHQLGWNHHKMVIEQLQNQAGIGVILSPRDLSYSRAQEIVPQYKAEGASVVLDPQWHVPGFSNLQFEDYPSADLRASVSNLVAITDSELDDLRQKLISENSGLQTDALIAPAVVYAAGRNDIVQLNARLHNIARSAASEIGIPCYGTAFLGRSITNTLHLVESTLSAITSLNCDGWYFGFEFPAERIPSSTDGVYRCLRAALLLVQTGQPVLHAYAGPLGILSFAAGCTAAASGPSQKQWRYCPERWEDSGSEGGGGGAAPARYFSRNLWGTIVFPDETTLLPQQIQNQIFTPSPFAPAPLPPNWTKTNALKHLTYSVCKGIESIAANHGFVACRQAAEQLLDNAVAIHAQIASQQFPLKDATAAYQGNWRAALNILAQNHGDDFDFLEMLL